MFIRWIVTTILSYFARNYAFDFCKRRGLSFSLIERKCNLSASGILDFLHHRNNGLLHAIVIRRRDNDISSTHSIGHIGFSRIGNLPILVRSDQPITFSLPLLFVISRGNNRSSIGYGCRYFVCGLVVIIQRTDSSLNAMVGSTLYSAGMR